MPNKIVKIPVSDISGLKSEGGYSLRYRIVSKDKARKSEWSELSNLVYNTQENGKTASFYEIYAKLGRPSLADAGNLDPHPSNAYSPSQVFTLLPTSYIMSQIAVSDQSQGVLSYSWDSLDSYPIAKSFDIYLSFRDATNGWSDWTFAGTTSANTFSFTSPNRGQYVQAAVFLSSYPKLTNIFQQEVNFVSISPVFNAYRDSGTSTLGSWTAATTGSNGKYTATISSLNESFPTLGWQDRRVFDEDGIFAEAKVTVKERLSSSSIKVESNVVTTTGTLTGVRLI